jgi:two-component system CheB/CheR fusion protein
MAREGLWVPLRNALQQVADKGKPVRVEKLLVKTNGHRIEVNLEVLPVQSPGVQDRCYLVLFEDARWRQRVESAPLPGPDLVAEWDADDDRENGEGPDAKIARLKQELDGTREYMQSLIEQHEAANEELQSANEEIQSSNEELQSINEELQTTKEEIQSSNEELTTVNEELRHRNEQLNQANNDLMNFLNSAQLVLLMLGPDLRIRWFTPQAEKLLNLISSDVGRPVDDIKLPISVPNLTELLAEVIDTVTIRETEVQDRQGRWYSLRLRPYKTMDNRIEGAVMALIDIDLQRRSQEALQAANRHKDDFLAMLAHELRNPLAPLRSHLDLLRLDATAGEEVLQSVEVMDRQVSHLTRLVDDLLDVARISRGRIEMRMEAVNLVDASARAIQAAQDGLRERGLELTTHLPEEPLFVRGDAMRLEQIIGNLLSNAIKYTNAPGRIELQLALEGDQAVLRISDNGIGIAPDVLPHIFDLFVQSDVSYSRDRGGLGIGLALVKKIVELHGGTIEAHSAGVDQGSQFTVRLPLASAKAAATLNAEESRPAAPPDGKLRLLLVDDNLDAAQSLGRLLSRAGHTVKLAHSAAEGFEAARDFHPDVAILDIGLPGMDGCQLAERIRELPNGRSTKLVALTGYSRTSDQERFKSAGFMAHFTKPVLMENLNGFLATIRPGG